MTDSKRYRTMRSFDLNAERERRTSMIVTTLMIVDSASEFSEHKKARRRKQSPADLYLSCRAKERSAYAFTPAFTASAVIGNERMRAPQAQWIVRRGNNL